VTPFIRLPFLSLNLSLNIFFKDFLYLTERQTERARAEGGTGEEQADLEFPLSREPAALAVHGRTLRS